MRRTKHAALWAAGLGLGALAAIAAACGTNVLSSDFWVDIPAAVDLFTSLENVAERQNGLKVDRVAYVFDPVRIAMLPDGTPIFGEKKTGILRLIRDGKPDALPTLDLNINWYFHRGMVGLEVDPKFNDNGYIYVFYTTTGFGKDNETIDDPNGAYRLSRFTMDRSAKTIDPATETVLFECPLGGDNHPGSAIAFHPDDTMYFTMGDGQIFDAEAQDPASPYGKVHRIRRDGSIPADNPYGPTSSVYAIGFRDPFGIAIDKDTGAVIISENGTTGQDELNRLYPKGNYGWPLVEGVADTSDERDWAEGRADFVPPMKVYGPLSPSLTGMLFEKTGALGEDYRGALLVAHWNLGKVVAVWLDPTQTRIVEEEDVLTGFGVTLGVVDIRQNPVDGSLWVTDSPESIFRVSR